FTSLHDLINGDDAPNFSAKTSSALAWDDTRPLENGFDFSSSANMDMKAENISSTGHRVTGSGSSYAHSEDGSIKSGLGSPRNRSGAESPPLEFPGVGKKSLGDGSNGVKETQSEDHRATSSNSGDAFGDGGEWASAFATGNDENDSYWGYEKNAIDTKSSSGIGSPTVIFDGGREKQLDKPTFDSGDSFKLKSLRISSPRSSGDNEE
ncbi:hypothetical protein KI387_009644, partial [Taxus chinensis]